MADPMEDDIEAADAAARKRGKNDKAATPDSVAQDQLRAFVERIERMNEEKKAVADDIREIYAEAKGDGFDTKVLRSVVRMRAQDRDERLEQQALTELYLAALGML